MNRGFLTVFLLPLALMVGACSKISSGPMPPAVPGARPMFGNEGGNGGDTLNPENGSAWFLSPTAQPAQRYISLCFERAPGFGTPDEDIRSAISTAIDNWEVFLDFKGISLSDGKNRWKPTVAFMPSIAGNTYSSNPALISSACRGNEDLQMFFGDSTRVEVKSARKRFTHPIALAYREQFDLEQGWGRGLIWVAGDGYFGANDFPKWDVDSLTAILVHELGHVLGCDHVSGTIMRADILEFLKSYFSLPQLSLIPFKINRERELLLSRGRDLLRPSISTNAQSTPYKAMYDDFFGTTVQNSYQDDLLFYGHLDARTDQHALAVFWGHPLSRNHVRLFEKVERREFQDHYEFGITFKDSEFEERYVLRTPPSPLTTASQAKVFQMAKGQLEKSEEGGTSEIYNGTLTAADGKTYSVLIQRNSVIPLAGIAIWFTDGNKYYPLFYPDPAEGLWTNLVE